MKKIIKFIIYLIPILFLNNLSAQEVGIQPRIGKYYAFTNGAIKLDKCSSSGDTILKKNIIIPVNYRFVITKILKEAYVISIRMPAKKEAKYRFKDSLVKIDLKLMSERNKKQYTDSLFEILAKNNYEGENIIDPNCHFFLPKSDFVLYCGDKLPQSDFIFGLTTLPIKMRFGSPKKENGNQIRYFDFSGEISLGISLGWRYRTNSQNSYSLLTGLSITSIPIDSFTSKGIITKDINASALTWHLGFLYQHKIFQIGLFTGVDYLKGELGKKWVYRNKLWLGIGLGITIFNTDPAAFSAKK